MSQSTVTAPRRRSSSRPAAAVRRRASVRRRRRSLIGLATVVAAVVVVVLAMPLAQRAVNDFGLPLRYQQVIRQQAAEKRLDPALIAAVIYAETKFDARTSSAGAEGLMQILPATAEFLAHRSGATTFRVADLASPQVNITYGSYYLRYLLDSFGGNKMLALAAYNGGQTNVDQWIANARAHGHALTVNEIPFPETRAYVEKVLSAQRRYRSTYPSELGYG